MNYQNLLCLGDSLTFGARSDGCFPLHLARILSEETPYAWRTINRSANGFTARDLWFKVNEDIDGVRDTYQATLLIGTNDISNDTDCDLFAEYYRQILRTLVIKGYKAVYCGQIPPVHPDGHVFFERSAAAGRRQLNDQVTEVVNEVRQAHLVPIDDLGRELYEDSVHFNERGNIRIAELFAASIISR